VEVRTGKHERQTRAVEIGVAVSFHMYK